MLAARGRGFNSWNYYHCNIDENTVKAVADAIASNGMKEAGYEYVNIDDCWMASQRSADGHLLPHPKRFPSGMKALGDYIHSKGLKFGIYSCAGLTTCDTSRAASCCVGPERCLRRYDHGGASPAIS